MPLLALVGDIHLRGKDLQNRLLVFSEMMRICDERGVSHILNGGDLFDKGRVGDKNAPSEEIINKFIAAFDSVENQPQMLLVSGNHDQYGAFGNGLDFIHHKNILRLQDQPQVTLIDPEVSVVSIPWIRNDKNYAEKIYSFLNSSSLPKTRVRIILGHLNIVGCSMGSHGYITAENYFSFGLPDLTNCEWQPTHMFFSHIHSRMQISKNAWYLGALTQLRFDEDEGKKAGFHLLDTSTGVLEFIDLSHLATEYFTIQEEDLLNYNVEKDYVRFFTKYPEKYKHLPNVTARHKQSFEGNTVSEFKAKDLNIDSFIKELCKAKNLQEPANSFYLEEKDKLNLVFSTAKTGIDRVDRIKLKGVGVHTDTEVFFKKGFNCVTGSNGKGKAQPMTEPVLTPDGWKSIGSLRSGNKVYDELGNLARVTGVYYQGLKDVYRISFNDGTYTHSCADHLWKIRRPGNKDKNSWTVVPLSKLIEMPDVEKKHFHIPVCGEVKFTKKEQQLDPYLLGLLLGDGGIKAKTSVNFTTTDSQILEELRARLPAGVVAVNKTVKGVPSCSYALSLHENGKSKNHKFKNTLINELRNLNLQGTGSYTKFIPTNYLTGNKEQRLELLQGLMDTDGYISSTGSIDFVTASERLAEDMKFLIRSLSGVVKHSIVYKWYNKSGQKRPYHRLAIKINTCPFKLKRKADRFKTHKSYIPAKLISKIELMPNKQRCVCISVSSAKKTYLTNDFIVTHNTTLIESLYAALYETFPERGNIKNFMAKSSFLEVDCSAKGADYKIRKELANKRFLSYLNGKCYELVSQYKSVIEPIFGDSTLFGKLVFMDQNNKFDLVKVKDSSRLQVLRSLFDLTYFDEKHKEYKDLLKEENGRLASHSELQAEYNKLKEELDSFILDENILNFSEAELTKEKLLCQELGRRNREYYANLSKLEELDFLESFEMSNNIAELYDTEKAIYRLKTLIKSPVLSLDGVGCKENLLPCRFLKQTTPTEMLEASATLAKLQKSFPEKDFAQYKYLKNKKYSKIVETRCLDGEQDASQKRVTELEAAKAAYKAQEQLREAKMRLESRVNSVGAKLGQYEAVELQERIDALSFLVELCSKTGISLYIIDVIKNELQEILDELIIFSDLDIKITLSTSKKDNLDSFEILFGKDQYDVNLASGGEIGLVRILFKLAIMVYLNRYFGSYKILILDEPTAPLDDQNTEAVVSIIKKLCKEFNQIIVVSHSDILSNNCDHRIFI